MSLAVLDKLVQERADQMPEAVFGLLFDKAKKDHILFANHHLRTNGCECDYCRTLNNYVNAKLRLHRIKKRMEWDDFESGSEMAIYLTSATEDAKKQRQLKNEAKEL